MWPVVQFYISNMSSPVQFQLESGHQVLPPRRRWDLCGAQLQQFGRKDPNFRVVGEEWRCRAQEFLLGLWQDFEMAAGSIDFHDLPSMFATQRDSQLVQVFMFEVVPFPSFE